VTEDTSAYWRKLLALDQSLPPDPLKNYHSWLFGFNHLIFFLFGLISRFWAPITAIGAENVPLKPPYILCPNHLSVIDYGAVVLPLPARVRPDLYPLATKHFYDNPITGTIIKMAARAVRIDTMEDFFPALREAARILRAGRSVYLNPEGTRSPTGELLPFKVGVGILAVELNVPVVRVFIRGTYEILKPGSATIHPGPIQVAYGRPIDPMEFIKMKENMQAYDIYKAFTEELRRRILELSK
jgi:1-acyl-sn-glycerol-3-phosphate acyltransferase